MDALAAISESPDRLIRTFLTPEHRRATELVAGWMRGAGMDVSFDGAGNVVGRYEGISAGLPALMFGSHLDTVEDAGRYDGMLGVVTAITCVAELDRAGKRFPFAIEVVGFGDEEGVRFGTTMLGSRALAGTFDSAWLNRADRSGISMAVALRDFGLDPAAVGRAARRQGDILAYIELHIEQGPVLESRGLAVGCVTSITGATRLVVEIIGEAGHAGTAPMLGRRDALAAAAECILAIEARCGTEEGLVGTVGRIAAEPGAINVIPGKARFTVDVRAPDDSQRERCLTDLLRAMEMIVVRRGLKFSAERIHELSAVPCTSWLMDRIDRAIGTVGLEPFRLPSGAGHDAMAMAAIADIGMIFVRCAGGISHNPAESISVEDAEIGARVLAAFIADFEPKAS